LETRDERAIHEREAARPTSGPPRRRVVALQVGFVARRALAPGRRGRATAVFEHSVYLSVGAQWIAIADGVCGPIAILIPSSAAPEIAADLRVGDAVETDRRGVHLGGGAYLDLTRAPTWQPPAPPIGTPGSLRRGLRALRSMARDRVPREGLGACLLGEDAGRVTAPVLRMAAPAVTGLRDWLSGIRYEPQGGPPLSPPDVRALVGLGPGLTPSGDDFLAGALIAAHAVGRADLARSLFDAIERCAARGVGPISRAHLEAASEGAGHAHLHAALGHILAGDTSMLSVALDAIDGIGHTSGWDALAGAVTLLDALESGGGRRRR
jgi:hypothetical protein